MFDLLFTITICIIVSIVTFIISISFVLSVSTRFTTKQTVHFYIDNLHFEIDDVVSIVNYSNCIKVVSMSYGRYYQSANFSKKNKISWVVV